MTDGGKQSLVALRQKREQAIELLSQSFADDLIDIDEFESRVTLAHQATDVGALVKLTEDLLAPGQPLEDPPATEQQLVPQPAPAPTAVATRRRTRNVIAIMGGADRKGVWHVPEKLRVVALMGGADIDLREAIFPPGETTISVYAIMGGVDIMVPPTLAVEADGIGIMGGFDAVHRVAAAPDPNRPVLRITGLALMGGVDIKTRLPGESWWQARKREKKHRKMLRRDAKKQLKS